MCGTCFVLRVTCFVFRNAIACVYDMGGLSSKTVTKSFTSKSRHKGDASNASNALHTYQLKASKRQSSRP